MDPIAAGAMVRAAVLQLNESIKSFSNSSDFLAKVMIAVMVLQVILAVVQIFIVRQSHDDTNLPANGKTVTPDTEYNHLTDHLDYLDKKIFDTIRSYSYWHT